MFEVMLKALKLSVFHAAKTLGLFSLIRRTSWRRNRLLVLCYHGIAFADEHVWAPGLYLSPETFRQRMQLLKDRNYTVLPLDEALQRLAAGTLPPDSVSITFDDGEYNFHALAYPILRSFGFPATVYLATYYCENQIPVFDVAAYYYLWKAIGREIDFGQWMPGGQKLILDQENVRSVYLHLREFANAQGLSGSEKDILLRELMAQLGQDHAQLHYSRIFHLMDRDEAAEVARNQITVELHTHRHRTPRDPALFLREIEDNRRSIQAITGVKPKHFCYPSGDYVPEYFAQLKDAGVVSATTCELDIASAANNPFQLPRMLDAEPLDPVEVEAWLSGFAGIIRSWR